MHKVLLLVSFYLNHECCPVKAGSASIHSSGVDRTSHVGLEAMCPHLTEV